jgi:hypothetical protein
MAHASARSMPMRLIGFLDPRAENDPIAQSGWIQGRKLERLQNSPSSARVCMVVADGQEAGDQFFFPIP